jgi:DNA-binding NtrC family response regulator
VGRRGRNRRLAASPYKAALDATRAQIIREALTETGGHRTKAAERLGIRYDTLWRMIRRLGLDVPDGRSGRRRAA